MNMGDKYNMNDKLYEQLNNENKIFNERTNFFLLANTFLSTVNFGGNSQAIFVCFALILVDIIWLLSSRQSIKVILKFIDEIEKEEEKLGLQPKIYEIIGNQLCGCKRLRPTELLGLLPYIFLISWLVIILNIIFGIGLIQLLLILVLIVLVSCWFVLLYADFSLALPHGVDVMPCLHPQQSIH